MSLQSQVRPAGRWQARLDSRFAGSRFAGSRLTGGSRFAALGVCLVLGGCFAGTERPDVSLDIPRHYRDAPRNADAALPAIDWWRGFRSPELTALVEEALASNLDIAAAVSRIVQADAQARVTGSALLPVVDLDASASRSRATGVERSNFNASFSAAYEIDFWGRNRSALRSAEQTAMATRFDRETIALTTVAAVANSYFQVLAAQDRLRAARENLEAASGVFGLIEERVRVGTASALDTAQQETVLATQRATIPPLEQVLRESRITLALLLGRAPASVTIRGGTDGPDLHTPVTPGLPSDLLVRRPDIRSAEALLEAADADVEAARAAMLPSIQLAGSAAIPANRCDFLLRPELALFNLAAGLTQPIFDGLRLQGLLDLSRGRQDELVQIYRRAAIGAFGDVERALNAVRFTAERERLLRRAVDSSRRAFQISETQLREGAVDLITVLNTQQSLFQNPGRAGRRTARTATGLAEPVPGARRRLADAAAARSAHRRDGAIE